MGTRLSFAQLRLLGDISKGQVVVAKITRSSERTVLGMGVSRYRRDGNKKGRPVDGRTINARRWAGLVKWVDREHFRYLALKSDPTEWDELWSGDPEYGKIPLGVYGGGDRKCRLGYWHKQFFCQYATGTRLHCTRIGRILAGNVAKFYFPR